MGQTFAAALLGVMTLLFSFAVVANSDDGVALQEAIKNLQWVTSDMKRKEAMLREALDQGARQELGEQLGKARKRYEASQARLIELAAGIAWDDVAEASDTHAKRDLITELQELVTPVIDALQRASKRPRKIEALRRDIDTFESKVQALSEGLGRVNAKLLPLPEGSETKVSLLRVREVLSDREREVKIHLDELRGKLQIELSRDLSFISAATEMLQDFFALRGRNLLLAVLVFVFVWVSLFKIKKWCRPEIWFSKKERTRWIQRPLILLYNVGAAFAAFLSMLLCFYFLNDWVLLTFFTLVLLSFIWSLKQLLPKFIIEGKLLLNLGTVKEGERIIWNGIPWRVAGLGPYSTFINEDLEGGMVRVQAKDLLGLYSRPVVEGERWFPTKKGDFIELSDETFGEVMLQTPEQVVVATEVGTTKIYSSENFISLVPQIYSQGYLLQVGISLDYEYLPKIASMELQQLFTRELCECMSRDLQEQVITSINVVLDHAQESSIDLVARVRVSAKGVALRRALEAEVKRLLLKISEKYHLKIPFPQMVVHSSLVK
ncbi:MAG: hypothetical protein HQK50_17565 [Oligoflexia bacterium]|nr:hypothetical protein [Oligoflexia bacterium]MBF0367387.1 hypothetical protein [Oligoflexia bacterium]